MLNRKVNLLLATTMTLCVLLSSCGGDSSSAGGNSSGSSSNAGTSVSASNGSSSTAGTFVTSESNRVVTENGTFTKEQAAAPVLITSVGQSADVSMLDALMKKVGAEYTYNATAPADEVAGYKTVIIASGASSKGLGAAGISQEDEIARAEAIAQVAEENDIAVIVAHLGGSARRGTLSDQFNNLALSCADYVMVVEEGNEDGFFTNAATDAGIPITLLFSIADAITPLQEIFG